MQEAQKAAYDELTTLRRGSTAAALSARYDEQLALLRGGRQLARRQLDPQRVPGALARGHHHLDRALLAARRPYCCSQPLASSARTRQKHIKRA